MSNFDNKNRHSGFFIGFIIGVASALLLNTKKGKKILNVLIDQGIDRISNWEEVVKTVLEEDEEFINGDDYTASSGNKEKSQKKIEKNEKETPEGESHIRSEDKSAPSLQEVLKEMRKPDPVAVEKVKSATRRFFRGIKKKKS